MRDKDELKLFSTETLTETLRVKLDFLNKLPRFSNDRNYDFNAKDIRQELKQRLYKLN